jgi:hypothetical protein
MLEPGTSFDANAADALVTKLVTDFAEGFRGPVLQNQEAVLVQVINNDRFRLTNLNGFEFDLISTGEPIFGFRQDGQAGISDGAYTVTQIPEEDQFVLALPFQSPAGSIAFKPEDIANGLIVSNGHFLLNGARAIYNSNAGTVIPELDDGSEYFVSVIDEKVFGLANTFEEALLGEIINLTTGVENNEIHSILFTTIAGRIEGVGKVNTTSGSRLIQGVEGSLFQRYFKVGDEIFIKNNNTNPGRIFVAKITAIADDTELEIDQEMDFTAVETKYFLKTKLYVRPDGYAVHRPFDGGVEMAAGTAPLSQIVRQTRKYFRYQSGKGIQTSLAINFNPPVLIETIEGTLNTTASSANLTENQKTFSVLYETTDVFNIATLAERGGKSPDLVETVVSNPTLTLYRGQTYQFSIDAPGHPF